MKMCLRSTRSAQFDSERFRSVRIAAQNASDDIDPMRFFPRPLPQDLVDEIGAAHPAPAEADGIENSDDRGRARSTQLDLPFSIPSEERDVLFGCHGVQGEEK